MIQYQDYPVSAVFEQLKKEFRQTQSFVIKADPGAGKSAILPLYILEEDLVDGRIIILEPRRMAARSLALFMSRLTGTECGTHIGYRVRGDSRCRPGARIEIVTEGVFIRIIQEDPFLDGVSLVILDEFHERNLNTDLSFAFLRDVQNGVNPDLKLMIMTATPEIGTINKIVPDHLFLECTGRMYPVTVKYDGLPLESCVRPSRVRNALEEALERCEGNVLIFLPGEGEIRMFMDEIERNPLRSGVQVLPLYGRLKQSEQDRALNPGSGRIVVASTSIAETSLTIPGIGCVIDTGLERKPVFDVNAGLSRLMTRSVSKASARQRTGRAGRVREGLCIRLWNNQDEYGMDDHSEPEILHTDLSSLVLEVFLWGVRDYRSLHWIEPPPAAHYHQARSLLFMLGIIDREDRLRKYGKEMASMGVHPRLAHMLYTGREIGLEQTACAVAAVLTEGDWLDPEQGSDMRLRLEKLKYSDDRGNRRISAVKSTWKSLLGKGSPDTAQLHPEETGRLLCFSFPDRVALQRGDRLYQLSGGGECGLRPSDPLQGNEYLIVPLVGGGGSVPVCFLATPLEKSEILKIYKPALSEEFQFRWDEKKNRLVSKKQVKLGFLVLYEMNSEADTSQKETQNHLKDYFSKRGLAVLPWQKEDLRFLERCRFTSFLIGREKDWPDFSEQGLLKSMDIWFIPLLTGGRLEGSLKNGLESLLTWEDQQFIRTEIPATIAVPSGSRIRIDYSNPESPAVDVRLQELFGLYETPLIAGEIPLVFRLLNPAQRPIQVTRDLKNFWENTYQDVRKELRGRYPKHYWPENPFEAQATKRIRPQ